ncbi:hypothetical protein PTKIN_Ptkin16aG0095000 [Pterospermum kingtungense]
MAKPNAAELGKLDGTMDQSAESVHSKNKWKSIVDGNWRDLFPPEADQTMDFYLPGKLEDESIVAPPLDEEGELQWKNSLVVQFIGKIPNFSYFVKMVTLLWGSEGGIEVKPTGQNLFLVKFSTAESRDKVLESGPWHLQNRPLIIRKWEPRLRALDLDLKRIPVWVHLHDVPYELFTKKGLSYIASVIGHPLYMDKFIAKQQRLAYAKVCIELDAAREIPKLVKVRMKDGSLISVRVEVPWFPTRCQHCCIFGHGNKECPKKHVVASNKVWVVKQNATVAQTESSGKNNAELQISVPLISNAGCNKENKDPNSGIVSNSTIGNVMETKVSSLSPRSVFEHGSTSGSRFELLEENEEIDAYDSSDSAQDDAITEEGFVDSKVVRAAALGVAELLDSIKPKPRAKGGTKKKLARKGLKETSVKSHNVQKIVDRHSVGWKLLHNYAKAPNGRVWVLWKKHVKVDLIATSAQCITCMADSNHCKFILTAVYGKNDGVDRRSLWNHLIHLSKDIELPWLLAGDFNVIAGVEESSNEN